MTNSITKILSIVVFLVLISQGYGQCTLKDLSIKQSPTGVKVEGKPEFSVTITNGCLFCVQQNVILNCNGFRTIESIDPSILRISGSLCVVKNGQPISDDVSFKYASDNQFPFKPISSKVSCSN